MFWWSRLPLRNQCVGVWGLDYSLTTRPHALRKVPWYRLSVHTHNFPQFWGISKTPNIYCTSRVHIRSETRSFHQVPHKYGNIRRLLLESFVRSVSSGKGRNDAQAGIAADSTSFVWGYMSSVCVLVAARGYIETTSLATTPLQWTVQCSVCSVLLKCVHADKAVGKLWITLGFNNTQRCAWY